MSHKTKSTVKTSVGTKMAVALVFLGIAAYAAAVLPSVSSNKHLLKYKPTVSCVMNKDVYFNILNGGTLIEHDACSGHQIRLEPSTYTFFVKSFNADSISFDINSPATGVIEKKVVGLGKTETIPFPQGQYFGPEHSVVVKYLGLKYDAENKISAKLVFSVVGPLSQVKCADTDISAKNIKPGVGEIVTGNYYNVDVKGTAVGIRNGKISAEMDECLDGKILVEKFCDAKSSIVFTDSVECPLTCGDGRCLSAEDLSKIKKGVPLQGSQLKMK